LTGERGIELNALESEAFYSGYKVHVLGALHNIGLIEAIIAFGGEKKTGNRSFFEEMLLALLSNVLD
jgi:hypothetical protein